MSTQIDDRVVAMKFDARDFNNNVQQTMSLLEKFKDSLKFEGAKKGFEDISAAADSVDLKGMQESIGTVEASFSAMSIVAISAINNIVNSAMNAGKQIVKSLTIDQVTSGFSKYEEKVKAVQTIMNATGLSIEEVSAQLDRLSWFTDETSYSFSDMVNNVGKFTSYNIPLDKSITAMQGIANWAAVSGAGVNEAARAMYNLSQAMSKGYVQLLDWRSIENANMSTTEFKQAVLDAATAVGTLRKEGELYYSTTGKAYTVSVTDFTDSMSEGWFTSDVLMQALGRYGEYADAVFQRVQETGESCAEAMAHISAETMELGEKAFKAGQEAKTFTDAIEATKDAVSTGWMRTFELLLGNYEEAKEVWTELAGELYEIFAASGDVRNEMLKSWAEMGGRVQLITTIKAAYAALLSIVKPLKEAINEMFPALTAEKLRVFTVRLRALVNAFKLSEDAAYTLKVAMKAVLLPLKALLTVAEVGVVLFAELAKYSAKLGIAFLELWSQGNPIEDLFRNLFGDERYTRLMEAMATIVTRIGNGFTYATQQLGALIIKARSSTKLTQAFEKLSEILGPIAEFILDAIVYGVEALANFDFDNLRTLGSSTLEVIRSKLNDILGIVGSLGTTIAGYFGITKTFEAPMETIGTLESSFISLNTTIGGFKSSFNLDNILSRTDGVATTLGNVISGLGDAIGRMSERLGPAQILLYAFGAALTGTLLSAMNAFKGITGLTSSVSTVIKNFGERLKPDKITRVATAIGLLAGALLVLSLVDAENLAQATISMLALAAVLGLLTAAMAGLDNILKDNSQIDKISAAMTKLSGALLIMSIAMNILSRIELEGLPQKMIVLGTIIAALGGMSILMAKFAPALSKNGWTLVAYALAINTVIGALKNLEKVNVDGLLGRMASLVTIIGLLGAMSIAMKNIKASSAIGVTLMIANIFILFEALKKMAEFPIAMVINAIPAYLTAVLLIGGLMESSARAGKNAAKAAIFIVAAAGSLVIIGEAIKNIGELDRSVAVQGGVIVAAMLGIFTTMTKMTKYVGAETDKLAKGLVMMSISIMLLGVCISYLGALDLKQAVQGTLVVSALLGVFLLISKMNSTVLKEGEKLKGGAANIIAMAALIGTMSSALALLTLLPSADLMNAAASLAIAMLGVGAAVKLMANMNFKGAVSTAASMLVLMSVVALVMSQIAKIDTDASIIAKAAAVSLMLIALATAVKILPEMGTIVGKDGYLVIAELTAVIGALAGVLYLIKDIDPVSAIANATALSGMLLALTVAIRLLPSFQTVDMVGIGKAILAFSVCIFAFAEVLKGMNDLNPVNSLANATALSELILALSLAIKLLPAFNSINKEELVAIGLLSAAVGLFGYVLYQINDIDPVNGLLNATALSTLLIALAAAARLLPSFTNFDWKKVGAALLELEVAMAGLALILKLIDALDIEVNLPAVVALGALTVALAGAARLMNGLTEFNFVAAIQAIGAVAIIIGGILTALYLLKDVDWTGIENGIAAFTAVGQAIGGFIGGLVSGLINAGLAFIPTIGSYLSQFIENSMGFLEGVKKIDSGVLTGAQNLAATMILLCGAELVQGITGWLMGPLGAKHPLLEFGRELAAFGPFLAEFANSIKDIDGGTVATVSNAVKALAEAYGIINTGILDGIADVIFGENSLADFGKDLAEFGPYFAEFANSLGEVDANALEATIAAAKCMAEFEKALPKHGGWAATILGDADLGTFGENLVTFGDAIVAFNAAITKEPGLDITAIEQSAAAGKALATLENNLRGHGGGLQQFFGDADLATFGSNLESFGTAMMGYSAIITEEPGLNIDAIKQSAKAGEALAELEKGLVGTNGSWQSIFGGNQTLGNFAENLKSFGEALSGYNSEIQKIDSFDKIRESKDVAELFAVLEEALPEDGGIFKWFDGKQDLTDFGKNLESLAKALVTYDTTIADVNFTRFATSVTQLQKLADMGATLTDSGTAALNMFPQTIRNMAGTWMATFIETFETAETTMIDRINQVITNASIAVSNNTTLSELGGTMVTTIIDGIIQNESRLTVRGQDIVGFILMGISTQHDNLVAQGSYLVTCILTGMANEQFNFNRGVENNVVKALKYAREGTRVYEQGKEVGRYAISGIITGINNEQRRLEETMTNIAQMMIDVSKETLDEHSPSVEFKIIGKYVVQGLAKGIEQNEDELAEVMTSMNKDILEQAQKDWEINGDTSGVMRDKVGTYLIKGLAEGIYTDTSAEEAAEKKAQNILNAFQSTFDRYSILSTLSSSRYGLWESIYGAGATDAEILERQTKDYEERLALSGQTVMAKEAIWKAMVDQFGADAQDALEAEADFLSAYQEFVDLGNEYLQLGNESVENSTEETENAAHAYKEAAALYNQFMADYKQQFLDQGFSNDDIAYMARTYSGFDPNLTPESSKAATKKTIQDLMTEYIGDISIEIDAATAVITERTETAVSTGVGRGVSGASPSTVAAGGVIADDLGTGLSESNAISDAVGGLLEDALVGKDYSGTFAGQMENLIDGAAQTLEKYGGTVVDAGGGIFETLNAVVGGILGAHSPATVYIEFGHNIIDGLVIGLNDRKDQAIRTITEIFASSINATSTETNTINDIGRMMAEQIVNGLKQTSNEIPPAIDNVMNFAMQTVTSYNYKFEQAGYQLADAVIDGIIDGIRSGQAAAINEVVQLAQAMYAGAAGALGVSGMVTVTEGSVGAVGGSNGIGGVATGLSGITTMWRFLADQMEAAARNGEITNDQFQEIKSRALNTTIDADDFTIMPVIDFSNVEEGLAQIDAMFSQHQAQQISTQMSSQTSNANVQNGTPDQSSSGTTYNFYQTNNSPKAISRVELYRDTKNLLSAAAMASQRGS